ncbi:hypothetical protein BGZ81_010247 [Podila clonocystis]|nr:hypothetical protein BGZ81_010247 [Podila clonocystis]
MLHVVKKNVNITPQSPSFARNTTNTLSYMSPHPLCVQPTVFFYYLCIFLTIIGLATAGPLAYGICQTGCNAVAVACYAAAGFTFGTVTGGAGIPAVIAGCNTALGVCMAACIAAGCAPTP